MRAVFAVAIVSMCSTAAPVVIDRIAIIVNDRVVKDSDIEREIRVTDFLNGDPLQFTAEARRKAADRLIDQTIIRREMRVAQYPEATREEIDQLLTEIRKQRFGTDTAFGSQLKRYGITEEELRRHLAWQITVLHFIEQRFRPGILISNEEAQRYFEQHRAEFQKRAAIPVSLDDVRAAVEDQLAGERVNKEFFAWLDQSRKAARIEYREASLQ